jgi:predicted ATPase/class 3 adenylate cyclase
MAQLSTESAETLRPYVPRLTIRWLAEQPHLTFRTVEGSMVFVDISGFTKMSERLARHGKVGAEEVTDVLGAVFAKLLAVAYGEDGSLLKFGGDALLLWFSGVGHAARAASAANGMRATLRSVGRLDTTAGKVVLRMSVGVNSGSFHFFLVGDSHRELVVTGPAASQTVTMESTATAGEILVSRDTAAVLPAETIGRSKGEGLLLKRGPSTLAFDRDDKEVPLSNFDVTLCIPTALRDHLLSGFAEPEHRTATVAFVHFDGVDDRVMSRGADVVAAELHELVCCVQAAAETNGVTFLGTDIDHDGGKIILTGGAPSALGDDEGRMLLTLRAVIDAETALPIRIGVNRGPVFAGDIGPAYRRTYTVMGDAVNLAARVMSMAVPGQILSTGPVLEASSVAFNALPLEPFMVKGKKHPVHTFMVGHSTGSKRETVSRDLPLVGRDEEMDAFRLALLDVRAGRGSVLEVVGDAGMGKTRLLEEFRAEVPDLHHLEANCELYEASVSYLSIRRLLRLLIGHTAGDDGSAGGRRLHEEVSQRAPHLLPWLPLLAIVAGVSVPMTPEVQVLEDEFRKTKLEQVTAEYLSIVITEPTFVAIEDAHWMDGGSADLLREVSQRVTDLPWLICVTRRPEETGFTLPAAPRCVSLELTPLATDALESLIDIAMQDTPLHTHEMIELSDRSGGNPLYLQELLHAARSAGSVEGLPDSIEAMITTDIDRLPATDRHVLRYASALGMRFDRALLETVLEAEVISFRSYPWHRLERFVLDDGGGTYRFRHALMRDAAYEGLPYRRRRELHARVGGAILALSGDAEHEHAELLSLHFFLAGDFERAWRFSTIAAERAKAAYANIEAARFFRRASDAGRRIADVRAEEIATVEESAGDALYIAGEFKKAAEAYATARRLVSDDPIGAGRLLLKRSRIEESLGRYPNALRWATRGRKALQGLDEADAAKLRAQLSAWYATVLQAEGRASASIAWAERAISEARAAGDDSALARAYNALEGANLSLGRHTGEHWRQALSIYEELDDLVGQVLILTNLGVGAFYDGRWGEALSFYERARDLSMRIGDMVGAASLADNIAEIRCEQGQLSEAEEILRASLKFWQASKYGFFLGGCLRFLARVLARTGRFDEALSAYDEARRAFVHAGALEDVLTTDAGIAECRVLMAQPDEALAIVHAALERQDVGEAIGMATPPLERVRGYALTQSGDLEGARAAFELSLRAARERGDDYEVGLALCALVRLDGVEGRPAPPDLETEARSILHRLGIERVPEIPLRTHDVTGGPARGRPSTD